MARRKKRPKKLPARVLQFPTPHGFTAQPTTETRAVLVTDPRDTPLDSPTRPETATPAPMVHQPTPEPEPTPEPVPEPITNWYDKAVSAIDAPPTPSPSVDGEKVKVAVGFTDHGFEVVSQNADVAVNYHKTSALPRMDDTSEAIAPPILSGTNGAFPIFMWVMGFFSAVILVSVLLVGSRSPVIINNPAPQEVIR